MLNCSFVNSKFWCNFSQRDISMMIDQPLETSTFTRRYFSWTSSSRFLSYNTKCFILPYDVLNGSTWYIFCQEMIYSESCLLICNSNVVLHNRSCNMFAIGTSHSYLQNKCITSIPSNKQS